MVVCSEYYTRYKEKKNMPLLNYKDPVDKQIIKLVCSGELKLGYTTLSEKGEDKI